MNAIIREAVERDLPSIILLYAQTSMDDAQVISLEKAESILKRTRDYPFFKVYVAVLNKQIVGTFELLIMDNLAHLGMPSGIIEDVVVAEKHQRKGIGKVMMRYAMNVCKEMGCYKVSLSSNLKREAAHRFYKSIGFQKHGYSFYTEIEGELP
jgi:GNAT superfamily N-acetyltransferase